MSCLEKVRVIPGGSGGSEGTLHYTTGPQTSLDKRYKMVQGGSGFGVVGTSFSSGVGIVMC